MTKILLSCDADDFDIAVNLKFTIQEKLGFQVMLNVESWKETGDYDDEDYDLDTQLASAAVLLVFHFGDTNISAWVMIEDSDEIRKHKPIERESFFPECIDFSRSFKRGIKTFASILRSDYGVVAKRRQLKQ